ncbi:MAG: prepilin peptidase [Dehalococcoidia bacterium]|nr:prepilin peptidase [Dehalococcoidia bacterium]
MSVSNTALHPWAFCTPYTRQPSSSSSSSILNVVVVPMLVVALAAAPIGPPANSASLLFSYVNAVAGAAVAFGILFLIYLLSRGGMGEGDVEFGALMGAMLDWQLTIVALPLAFIAGGIAGAVLLLTHLKERKSAIPFGPFLSTATLVTLFFGFVIRDWYLSFVNTLLLR